MSKIFNDEWMIANGFIDEGKRKATVGDVLRSKEPLPPMITVARDGRRAERTRPAAQVRNLADAGDARAEVVGSINDVAVMQAVFDQRRYRCTNRSPR